MNVTDLENRVFNCDVAVLLKEIPDGAIDFVFCILFPSLCR